MVKCGKVDWKLVDANVSCVIALFVLIASIMSGCGQGFVQ